ncbi:hypothetical protein chiPu_0000264 [Chiloscyllium punctatum]|uniref:Uncharacterized protein n=1 Tax=Chiloscyllium punctatum TaxID=137246 RepID=A0A401RUT2_CHIPU|nr:hypothetical protein [Chiloscyllium punctatum]
MDKASNQYQGAVYLPGSEQGKWLKTRRSVPVEASVTHHMQTVDSQHDVSSSATILMSALRGVDQSDNMTRPTLQQGSTSSLLSAVSGWNFKGKKRKQRKRDEDSLSLCSLDGSVSNI